MNLLKKFGLTLLTAASFQTQAAAVWKVTSGHHTLYIGGTIHLLTAQDYPLPNAYDQAYKKADKVVFETDMTTLSDPKFKRKMQDELSYSDGTTIEQVVTPDTYEVLTQYLNSRQIPIAAIQHLKPSALAISLSVIELKHLGFTSEGVDYHYAQKAQQDKKPQGWLEAPESQIQMLSNLNTIDSDEVINYTLADIKNLRQNMEELRASWRQGDMEAMAAIELKDFQDEFPDVYDSLLVERNNNWLPQVENMLQDNNVEFIMVGAMHLAGPDSLLRKLEDRGYKVSKL